MIFRSHRTEGAALSWVATALGAGHLALVVGTGAARWEHVAVDVLLAGLGWSPARRFLKGALPLWLTGVMLDNQHLWLPLRGPIHTGDLWELERALFPATVDGSVSTWPAYFAAHPTVALDVLSGLTYATYLAEIFAMLLMLFARRDFRFERMAWTFFAVNALGCFIYVLYPAAPPWYVMEHGMGAANLAAPASAAGAARFDALIGVELFGVFYSRNPNVFGAMPSLHTAYPVVALWQVWHLGTWWRLGAAAYGGLIAFSAVYLTHHYLLDVLAGVAVAVTACAAVDLLAASLESRSPRMHPTLLRAEEESRV
jgi:membrane-associated phospholipid phosphatase